MYFRTIKTFITRTEVGGKRVYFCFFIYSVFLVFFETCRISVPQPGTGPVAPALGVPSLNHWTARGVLAFTLKEQELCLQ